MDRCITRWLRRGLFATILGPLLVTPLTTNAAPWAGNRQAFASPRFEDVWRTSDAAVAEGHTDRSWTWGPAPWFDYKESYIQSPQGLRQVQYFDKARMEINDPQNTSGSLGGVTNGLLVVELVSGRIKLGDGLGPEENAPLVAAPALPVAGDMHAPGEAQVTYDSFRSVATVDNQYRDTNNLGQRVGSTLTVNKEGTTAIGSNQSLANLPGTEIVVYERVTGHNVPKVFNDFRNTTPGIRAIDAFGYPITDAYWIKATVGGAHKDVLVQLFERRTLTYTPSNPHPFQVEMGNVGQHYFLWRYQHLGLPWTHSAPHLPIIFASTRAGAAFNVYAMNSDLATIIGGGDTRQRPWTYHNQETVPFSVSRSWDAGKIVYYGDSVRFNGKRQLVLIEPPASLGADRVTRILTSDANDYNPMVSPDGTKLAFVSDRGGNPELYLLDLLPRFNGMNTPAADALPTRLTETVDCSNQYPQWLPNGSGIVYESNCVDGTFEIFRGTLDYGQGQVNAGKGHTFSFAHATQLTTNDTHDRYPRVSPDGTQIAFTAQRDGNAEVYVMNSNGGQPQRITDDVASDQAPTWSPDGASIVWSSNREGNFDLFITANPRFRSPFPNTFVQLTTDSAEDTWPLWAQ